MHWLHIRGVAYEELVNRQFNLFLTVAHGVLSFLGLSGESDPNVTAGFSFFPLLIKYRSS